MIINNKKNYHCYANLYYSLAIPRSRKSYARAEAFAGFVEGGCEGDKFDGFKVVNRVVNPEGANGWAIVESSNHQNIWKWSSIWVDNFGVEIEVTPVLTDQEFLSVHKEMQTASS